MEYQIINGNNIEVLKQFPDNHFDSIVTDPPYGIDFLGKEWDANTGAVETYQECLRVLKPGGHILAFSAARTYHHLAITLEQAGFEIRDQIMWIYSSGFPKSQDIGRSIDRSKGLKGKKGPLKRGAERMINQTDENGNRDNSNGVWANEVKREPHVILPVSDEAKQWSGWGTALKPAHEPIALARKPTKLSIAKNVQKWGVGALNIDATRVPYADEADSKLVVDWAKKYTSPGVQEYNKLDGSVDRVRTENQFKSEASEAGRFPSNVIGEFPEDYQKYFYCPKVSRKERHMGFDLDNIPTNPNGILDNKDENGNQVLHIDQHRTGKIPGNNHPTVKPVALMEYLIKLVTPAGGLVLDPFNGSGSTGMAAVGLGYNYVGIDLDPNYVDIANKRIQAWLDLDKADNNFDELFEEDLEDDDE